MELCFLFKKELLLGGTLVTNSHYTSHCLLAIGVEGRPRFLLGGSLICRAVTEGIIGAGGLPSMCGGIILQWVRPLSPQFDIGDL